MQHCCIFVFFFLHTGRMLLSFVCEMCGRVGNEMPSRRKMLVTKRCVQLDNKRWGRTPVEILRQEVRHQTIHEPRKNQPPHAENSNASRKHPQSRQAVSQTIPNPIERHQSSRGNEATIMVALITTFPIQKWGESVTVSRIISKNGAKNVTVFNN